LPDGGIECVLTQLEHHLAYGTCGEVLLDIVEEPADCAQQQHRSAQQQQCLSGRILRRQVNGFGDEDGAEAVGS
jgi:hypothetical protein